jgi:hypothetical protein
LHVVVVCEPGRVQTEDADALRADPVGDQHVRLFRVEGEIEPVAQEVGERSEPAEDRFALVRAIGAEEGIGVLGVSIRRARRLLARARSRS